MIPVVNIAGAPEDFCDDLAAACSEVGFVALVGHRISGEDIAAMRAVVADVFAGTDDEKLAGAIVPDNYRGFIPLGFFTPNHPDVDDLQLPDQYEGYKLHWECPLGHPVLDQCSIYGQNRWVERIPEMPSTILEYWAKCDDVSQKLLRAFALALDLGEAAAADLLESFEAPLTNMTLLHYPAAPASAEPPVGIHPHKDTCAFTVLHPDPTGGLFVQRRNGEWEEAVCPPEALLVNIGDMMELWSGGRFISTPHQVINTSGQARYAFPYFAVPNHASVVEPLVTPLSSFTRTTPVPVGHWSLEVWRTNWPDEVPANDDLDLGRLRSS